MPKARKSGKYDVHITITKETYDEIERIRTKYGLNRSAMIELLVSHFDESEFDMGSFELFDGRVKW